MFFFDFDYSTAHGADHVVVMGVRFLIFKAREAVLKPSLLDEPSFSQQFQCAIDRCVA